MAIQLPDKVYKIIETFHKAGFQAYAVGGSVRDVLLGKETKLWDLTTNATPEQIQELFPQSFYDNDFGTVGVKIYGQNEELEDIFEITPFRTEGSYSDSRHPDSVTWGKTIEEDLARRDFTINAIALTINFETKETVLIDPFNGQQDLKNGIITAVGDPNIRFNEDALRLMRGIRIGTQLGFQIEQKTWSAIKSNSHLITKVSSERIRDELVKILSSQYPADGIKLLQNSLILEKIIPELVKGVGVHQNGTHHVDDVFNHSLNALKFCKSKNWVVRFATLLHDIGKPVTFREVNGKATFYNHETVGAHIAKEIANRLHFKKEDRDKIYMLVRWHMFSVSEFLTDAAIRRFIRRVGPENTSDMLDLRIADRLGSGSTETSWRLEEFKERIIEVQKHIPSVNDLKVNGFDVMKILNITPGPKIGEILNLLFEEIMEDPSKNEVEYLSSRVKELGESTNL